MPDLSDAVDFIVLFPNTFDLGAQIRVPFGTIGRQVWVFEDRCMRIECPLLSYDFGSFYAKLERLRSTSFMPGSGGGWTFPLLVVEDRR